MTIINPNLAAAIAAKNVPLSADLAPLAAAREADIRKMPVAPAGLAGVGHHGSDTEQRLYAQATELHQACGELLAEIGRAHAEIRRLKDELERRTEDLAFLERTTLPELRRTIQHHEDGKKRWRDRAEKAEPERDALQERLHQIALAKVWTNEDRKKFVFVEDIVGPLFGIEPKAGDPR